MDVKEVGLDVIDLIFLSRNRKRRRLFLKWNQTFRFHTFRGVYYWLRKFLSFQEVFCLMVLGTCWVSGFTFTVFVESWH